jgi:hypothetical protein
MSTKLPYPDFASESEEADWLYEHREQLDLYFSPTTGSLREMLLRDHNLTLPEAVIAVPLSAEDMERANAIAAAQGIDAEEYIGRVVHEALQAA